MAFNNKLHEFQNRVFDIVVYITYILYILVALGISATAPDLLHELQLFMKIYVSLFLIYRFFPFRHVQFTDLDAKIAFNAGWFLFITTVVNGILITYKNEIKTKLEFLKLVN